MVPTPGEVGGDCTRESKSGPWPEGPGFGEARPAWSAVPECGATSPAARHRGTSSPSENDGLTNLA